MQEEHFVKQVVSYFHRTWRSYTLFMAISLFAAGFNVTSHPIFTANGLIIINQSNTSPLQAISANVSGFKLDANKQALKRYILFFNSINLFRDLAFNLYSKDNFEEIYQHIIIGNSSPFGINKLKKIVTSNASPLSDDNPVNEEIENLAKALRAATNVSVSGPMTLQLTARTGNAKSSVLLVNELIGLAVKKISEQDVKELNDAKLFLSKQLAKINTRINNLEEKIIVHKKSSNYSTVDQVENEVGEKTIGLQRELVEYKIKIKYNNQLLRKYKKKAATLLAENSQDFLDTSKFSIKSKIFRLEKQNELYQARVSTLRPLLREYIKKQQSIPQTEQILSSYNKKLDAEYKYHHDLKKQIMKIEMQNMSLRNRVRAVEKAVISRSVKFVSSRVQAGTAILIALFLAALLNFLLDRFYPRVLSKKDLKELKIQYLGSVSEFNTKNPIQVLKQFINHLRNKSVSTEELDVDIRNHEASCFKHLRSRLTNKSRNKERSGPKTKVIAVVSPQPQEGKTFLTYNLSQAISYSKKKTLVIDFDFHKGHLTEAFNSEDHCGVSDYLYSVEERTEKLIQKIHSNLDFMPIGKSVKEVLSYLPEEELELLIAQLKPKYDFIIFDTPALLPVVDAIDIVKSANRVILCITPGKTRTDFVHHTVDTIRHSTEAPIGYVFNRDSRDEHIKGSYYYTRKKPKTLKAA